MERGHIIIAGLVDVGSQVYQKFHHLDVRIASRIMKRSQFFVIQAVDTGEEFLLPIFGYGPQYQKHPRLWPTEIQTPIYLVILQSKEFLAPFQMGLISFFEYMVMDL